MQLHTLKEALITLLTTFKSPDNQRLLEKIIDEMRSLNPPFELLYSIIEFYQCSILLYSILFSSVNEEKADYEGCVEVAIFARVANPARRL